jgi:hypothetical protein
MPLSRITHHITVVKGLSHLLAYARTHPHSAGWQYPIARILARLGVS